MLKPGGRLIWWISSPVSSSESKDTKLKRHADMWQKLPLYKSYPCKSHWTAKTLPHVVWWDKWRSGAILFHLSIQSDTVHFSWFLFVMEVILFYYGLVTQTFIMVKFRVYINAITAIREFACGGKVNLSKFFVWSSVWVNFDANSRHWPVLTMLTFGAQNEGSWRSILAVLHCPVLLKPLFVEV